MDRRTKESFCFVFNMPIIYIYLYIILVLANKISSNVWISSLISMIVTFFMMMYFINDISCKILDFFFFKNINEKNNHESKDHESKYYNMIYFEIEKLSKKDICIIFITIELLIIPVYVGKSVLYNSITDKEWLFFVGYIYFVTVLFFAIWFSTKICNLFYKNKKIMKKED